MSNNEAGAFDLLLPLSPRGETVDKSRCIVSFHAAWQRSRLTACDIF
jgi:hypothetical protein